MPDCTIITDDCLDVMGRLDPGCERLVFADPPYNAAGSAWVAQFHARDAYVAVQERKNGAILVCRH